MASASDILDDLITSASSAYQSYQSTQRGYTPLQPGTYVTPSGQVVTTNTPIGATTTTSNMLLLLGLFALIFLFAFSSLKK